MSTTRTMTRIPKLATMAAPVITWLAFHPGRLAGLLLLAIAMIPAPALSGQPLSSGSTVRINVNPTSGDGPFTVVWRSHVSEGSPGDTVKPRFGAAGAPTGGSAIQLFPVGISVDTHPREGTSSNSNGVLEPGEFVVVETRWSAYAFGINPPNVIHSVSGGLSSFTGPIGGIYSLGDQSAGFGDIPDMGVKSCEDGSADACYTVSAAAIGARPATHWDGVGQENLSSFEPFLGGTAPWLLHIGESFSDVPTDNQFYEFIETALHNGVTAGCSGGSYCPGDPVTRAQMAVFLLKSKFGWAHMPPPCTGTVFSDVPCTGGPFDPWIEELSSLGITTGCGGELYCPGDTVTREQMAVFLLKTREGSDYVPPACTGAFEDVPCTPGNGFSDWIEDLYSRGITGGCSANPLKYCPTNPNNRGQMATFLSKTFGLALYGL